MEAAARKPSRWNRTSMTGGYQFYAANSNGSTEMGNQEDAGIVSWTQLTEWTEAPIAPARDEQPRASRICDISQNIFTEYQNEIW